MRPVIGISPSWNKEESEFKSAIFYCQMVKEAGGEPVLLPYNLRDISFVDGMIFSGGMDISAELGKYEDTPLVTYDIPEREEFELWAFNAANERELPILGICRGHQLINCALGGSMIRDIPEAGFPIQHMHIGPEGYHGLTTVENSKVREFFGPEAQVWSSHHQAVKEPGEGFRITAWSVDGVVEAIEHENGRIIGLQTHPERMLFLPPFQWLINKCIQHKA